MTKKPSWKKLKIEYATTDLSYKAIASKYKVSLSTLTKQAMSEKWSQARKEYRKKLAVKSAEKISDKKADRIADLAMATDKMGEVIQKALLDDKQFYRFVDKSGNESVVKKVDSKAIREMTAAIKELTSLVRDLYNIPTEGESIARQLARERLEVEKRKAELIEEDSNENAGVILIPPVLEVEDDEDSMATTT